MNQLPDDSAAQLRKTVYLLLIAIGVGVIVGRILAVDSVDNQRLGRYLKEQIPKELERKRREFDERGVPQTRQQEVLAETERKLLARALVSRPFLSGNDRSRWCTLRALVEKDMRVERHIQTDHGIYVQWVPYAIDKVVGQPRWDTIDMVKHSRPLDRDPDQTEYLYSSKPPLLPTLMAGPYWVIHRTTGATLGTRPYAIGRGLLILFNVVPLIVFWLLVARLAERFGRTDWGRLFVVAAAVFGTFLGTFAVVLNNHIPGAVCATIAFYAVMRIWCDDERRLRYFALAGFFATFAVTCELPAAAFCGLVSLGLLWKAPRQTLMAYVPAALVVAVAFFGTNWIAHQSVLPPYAQREEFLASTSRQAIQDAVKRTLQMADEGAATGDESIALDEATRRNFGDMISEAYRKCAEQDRDLTMPTLFLETVDRCLLEAYQGEGVDSIVAGVHHGLRTAARDAAEASGGTETILDVDSQRDNPKHWYDYSYRREAKGRLIGSYWRNRVGIDRGEESVAAYVFHSLIGHHGIFSLTPVWLLAVAGLGFWLVRPNGPNLRGPAVLIAITSLVCLAFYLLLRPQVDRNYGGMTCGFRWMFWFAPLWLTAMLPAADWLAPRRWTRAAGLLLLALSVLSVSYPTWNPWTHPWMLNFLHYLGWIEV